MTLNEQKEQFSYAYVRAVAAVARVTVTKPEIDDDSVDLMLKLKSLGGPVRSPQIDAQVKCTGNANVAVDHVAFPLKLKNYHELRGTDFLVPRLLIVVTVSDALADWLNHTEHELALRRCGYWMSLRGFPDVPNQDTVTVRIPRTQHFTVTALGDMMARVANRQMI